MITCRDDKKIADELILVSKKKTEEGEVLTVNARDLHELLEIGKDFSNWIKAQIKRARLVENQDYVKLALKGELSATGQTVVEYHLTLEAGKHVSMMSRTDKGFEVRDYFIACEKALRGPQTTALTPSEALLQSVQMLVEQEKRLASIEQVVTTQAESIKRLEIKQSAAEDGHSFFTVLGYCSLKGIKLSMGDMQRLGRTAAKLSKESLVPIDRVRDARFGMVNSYHEGMLDMAFAEMTEGM